MDLLISLIAGAIGGNIAAGLLVSVNLGLLVNSLAGVLGGGLGAHALGWLGAGGLARTAADSAVLDPAALGTQLAAGALGGAACLMAAGLLRNLMTR